MKTLKAIKPGQQFVSPRQAAPILGVSEYLIYKGTKDGTIPQRTLGERILIPISWVLQGNQDMKEAE